jgi:hypothetical protein
MDEEEGAFAVYLISPSLVDRTMHKGLASSTRALVTAALAVIILSEDEFSADLLSDPGLAGDENTSRWLRMLGFLDGQTTLVDYHHNLISFTGEGHYDPDTESITIVDRPGRAFGELVRRYIMATAHQKYGLAAHERGVSMDDASPANRAVLEGYTFFETDLWYAAEYGEDRQSYDVSVVEARLSAIHRSRRSWTVS